MGLVEERALTLVQESWFWCWLPTCPSTALLHPPSTSQALWLPISFPCHNISEIESGECWKPSECPSAASAVRGTVRHVRGNVFFMFPGIVLAEKSFPRTGEAYAALPEGLSSGGSSLALLMAQEVASDTVWEVLNHVLGALHLLQGRVSVSGNL